MTRLPQQPPLTFYSEHDPKAVAWLRELIREGNIPPGVVDERDIQQLTETDLADFTQVHLFAGIAGWSHALRLAGWPDDQSVWTGSCPCQPFSDAGDQKGEADARHLWPEMRRLIAICHPPVIFGEQVASKLGREWLSRVRADLEELGYAVGAADLCAAGKGAPHIRQRLFWVANTELQRAGRGVQGIEGQSGGGRHRSSIDGKTGVVGLGNAIGAGLEGHGGHGNDREEPGRIGAVAAGSTSAASAACGMADANGWKSRDRDIQPSGEHRQQQANGGSGYWDAFDIIPCRDNKARRVEPGTFPLAHGIPGRVGLLRGYGNAIVPPLAQAFIEAYLAARDDLQSQRPQQMVDLIAPEVGRTGKVIVDLRPGHLARDLNGEAVGRPASGGDGLDDGLTKVGGHLLHSVHGVQSDLVDVVPENIEGSGELGVVVGGLLGGEEGNARVDVDVIGEVAVGVESHADDLGDATGDEVGRLVSCHAHSQTISDISDTVQGESQGKFYNDMEARASA